MTNTVGAKHSTVGPSESGRGGGASDTAAASHTAPASHPAPTSRTSPASRTSSAPSAAHGRPEVRVSSPMLIIGVMVVTAFVMILNETTVSIALPDLAAALTVSTSTIQWLISGFLITMAVVIPTTGFLLERFTPRAMYLASVGSFMLGTLLCGLAPGFPSLLIGRVVQACGTAVMIPLVMTTVMRLVPKDKRGVTMGTISIVIGVAPAVGPTVGGAIMAGPGWRWMFWLVLILAAIVFVFGLLRLHVPFDTKRTPLDLVSVALSAVGFAALVYGLSTMGGGAAVIPPWICVAIGVVALAAFAWRQHRLQRHDHALLDLRTLAYHRYRLALILSLFMFMALLGAGAVLLPIYLQSVLGHGTFASGLALLPGGLVMAAVSRPVGHLYDRVGARPLVIPGAIGMTIGLAGFALLGGSAPLIGVIGCDVLLMGSLGLMMTPLMTDALGVLTDHLYSHGSALLTTLQQVAGALGSAVFVALATAGSAVGSGGLDANGLRLAFFVACGIGACGIIVGLIYPRTDREASRGEHSVPRQSAS